MDEQLNANLQRLLAAFMQHAPPDPPAEITEEEKEVRRLHEESQRQLKIAVQRKEIAENQKKKEEVQRETEAIRREMRQERRERMRELVKPEPIQEEQDAEEPMVQPAQEHHPEVEFLVTENKVGIHPLLRHVKPEDEPGPAPPAQEFFDDLDQQLEMFEYAADEDQDQEIVMPQFDQQFEDVQDVPREPEFEDQEIVMEDVVDESKSRVEPRQLRSGRVLPGPNADLNFWRKRRGPNSKNAPKNAPKKSKKK